MYLHSGNFVAFLHSAVGILDFCIVWKHDEGTSSILWGKSQMSKMRSLDIGKVFYSNLIENLLIPSECTLPVTPNETELITHILICQKEMMWLISFESYLVIKFLLLLLHLPMRLTICITNF